MKLFKQLLPALITLIVVAIISYVQLIPYNLRNLQFWVLILIATVIYFIVNVFVKSTKDVIIEGPRPVGKRFTATKNPMLAELFKLPKRFAILLGIFGLIFLLGLLSGLPIWQAKSFANQIGTIQSGDFSKDLKLSDPSNIITVDRDMSEKLGDRKIGEMKDLVSQFEVSKDFVQIAVQDRPVRVSPLEYAGFWRWLTNQATGVPYYVEIDSITGDSKLVKMDQPIKYSKSEYFNRDVARHLWFNYPTAMVSDVSFELDEEGKPYYIATEVSPKIGFFNGLDVVGIFVIDAVTGEIQRFAIDEVPGWVDRVVPAELVLRQIDQHGLYQGGFWNSLIGKRGVTKHTNGYQYFVKDNDLYLYTGITSVNADESNVGFVLVNSRTKETILYDIGAATEVSAQESAQGSVQEKGYVATFPLLLNIEGKPTYFLSLKDNGGLIKLYAFVDAENYQRVVIGETVQVAFQAYTGKESSSQVATGEQTSFSGTVEALNQIVLKGETHMAFKLSGKEEIYFAPISVNSDLAFLKVGDTVKGEAANGLVNSIVIEKAAP